MTQPRTKQRLGRGLAALIGDHDLEQGDRGPTGDEHTGGAEPAGSARKLRYLPIETMTANEDNPRKQFSNEDIEALAASIRNKGVLQPIFVRPSPSGGYQIVAGERRWRAAQRAGLHEVPVVIRDVSDGEALEIALIENVQRSDLNPLEEARGYMQLMEQFEYTQQQLGESLGKSRSHIANTVRLVSLPARVRAYLEDGRLSAGHARAISAAANPEMLAHKIVRSNLSVRQAEKLSRGKTNDPADFPPAARQEKPADLATLEKSLGEAIGLHVEIKGHDGRNGKVIIKYSRIEQLEDICRRLTGLSEELYRELARK